MIPMHHATRSTRRSRSGSILTGLTLGLLAGVASAQQTPPPTFIADYRYDTGSVENTSGVRDVIASFTVFVQGASSVQLRFDEVHLAGDVVAGTESILRITSHLDGAVQELNRYHVNEWRRRTAYFNGDTVQVDIVAAPDTGPNRVRLGSVLAEEAPTVSESQCGPVDDRTPSSDPRAARILPVGCTGWLIDDCRNCYCYWPHGKMPHMTWFVLHPSSLDLFLQISLSKRLQVSFMYLLLLTILLIFPQPVRAYPNECWRHNQISAK